MSQSAATTAADFVLPPALVGRVDLARLVREVESVDADLESQKVRAREKAKDGGEAHVRLPAISRVLSDFLEMNKIDLVDDQHRMEFKEQLKVLKNKAPEVHLTFAGEADPKSLEQLTDWIRKELHPQALISIGVQPSLIGGVYIRTPNKVHDFSMRALFQGKTDLLVKDLEGLK